LSQTTGIDLAATLRPFYMPVWDNFLGLGERWLRDPETAIWYYILPSGQVLRENGANVTNLGDRHFASLPQGQAALFTAAINGTNVVINRIAGFTGEFWVLIEASDLNPSNRRRTTLFFKVIAN
jgi:hypothetical protein